MAWKGVTNEFAVIFLYYVFKRTFTSVFFRLPVNLPPPRQPATWTYLVLVCRVDHPTLDPLRRFVNFVYTSFHHHFHISKFCSFRTRTCSHARWYTLFSQTVFHHMTVSHTQHTHFMLLIRNFIISSLCTGIHPHLNFIRTLLSNLSVTTSKDTNVFTCILCYT